MRLHVIRELRCGKNSSPSCHGFDGKGLHFDDAVNRAYSDAGRFFVIPFTVGADTLVYNVNIISGGNGVHRAFRFAGAAVGALFGNSMCHDCMILIVEDIVKTARGNTTHSKSNHGFEKRVPSALTLHPSHMH